MENGDDKMRGNLLFFGIFFLVCTVVLSSCNSGAAKKPVAGKPINRTELKKIDKAIAEDEKASLLKQLETNFENPDTHYKLGKLYQRDGRWNKADHEFSTALSFDPVHRESQAAKVKTLIDSGNQSKAALLADIYMGQTANNAAASLRLGLAFQKEGLDDHALACYRTALNLAPNSAKINRQIGYYYLSKNQLDRAKEYLTRSFQLDPTQAEVAGELGRLGVVVQVPRKTETDTKKLDEMVDKANKPAK